MPMVLCAWLARQTCKWLSSRSSFLDVGEVVSRMWTGAVKPRSSRLATARNLTILTHSLSEIHYSLLNSLHAFILFYVFLVSPINGIPYLHSHCTKVVEYIIITAQ